MCEIALPSGAARIVSKLLDNGFDAYVVGGCVRDSLLGNTPNDWDICTSAKPDDVERCFLGNRIIETGLKHGTVTVVMDDEQYEVTTFRVDGDYSDCRRPDSVEFVSDVREDLARRDFTMNAMAYNSRVGLVDPFGGVRSLNKKLISCVGNPDDRFNEDALRILRALRFSSVFGFPIDNKTSDAIHRNVELLNKISAERICSELHKMLMGKDILRVLLNYPDVISTIIPELKPCVGFEQHNKYHQYTVYDHIAHAVDNYKGDDPMVRVALLLHDVGKPLCYSEDENGGHFYGHGEPSSRLAAQALSRLRFDNESQHDITELVLYHDAVIEPTPRTVRRWLNKVGIEQFLRLMDIRLADIQAHADGTHESRIQRRDSTLELAWEIIRQNQCFTMKDLMVNGDDVMSFGVPEGRRVGEILKAALNAVIDGEIPNERATLMSFIRNEVSGCSEL